MTGTTPMAKTNKYRSKLEERVAKKLQNKGVKFYYEPYSIPYTTEVKPAHCAKCGHNVMLKQRHYTPDLVFPNGVIVEIKGKFTGEMRTKMLAVRNCNPDLDIRMLFQADNWLTRKKATRYSDWCKRHNFTFHVGEDIPSDWME